MIQGGSTATVFAMSAELRIDKWLWCTRFFKTRSLAAKAVSGGHVRLNGARVKPSREVLAKKESSWFDCELASEGSKPGTTALEYDDEDPS